MHSTLSAEVRRLSPAYGFALLGVMLAGAVAAAAALGAYNIDLLHASALFAGTSDARGVLLDIRLPRVTLAALIGGSLGISGAALQGLFRNPLADPGLIGVSSGASLGAVAFIVLAGSLANAFALPFAALCGGLAVTTLVWRFARRAGRIDTTTLLLAGIALNSIAGAIIGILTTRSDDAQLRGLTFWLMGNLGGATWLLVLSVLAPIAIGIAGLLTTGRDLNAMALGERDGFHLGLDVERVKNRVVAASAIGVAGAVCAGGGIGFIGLVVPHIVRMLLGPNHRFVLPASALMGAIVLILADLIARTAIAPAELPVGVVTALIGAPFFLWLLFHSNRENAHA